MDESPYVAITIIAFITFMSIAFMIGEVVGSNTYRMTCLELNLGKETCDKIFKGGKNDKNT